MAADLPGKRGLRIRRAVRSSLEQFDRANGRYFAASLPPREHWRLFGAFRGQRVAYLDIETTGLGSPDDDVTTIALYDGHAVRHYVQGQNLGQFEFDIADYDLLVTFNGKSFDLPFLRKFMHLHLDQAHIDLMHPLRSLGLRGGLKSVEKQLGYDRSDLQDVDGDVAVLLWRYYQDTRDRRALETLLAYNVQDVLTLQPLMAFVYNAKLAQTPFASQHQLAAPRLAKNPFRASPKILRALGVGGA